MLMFFKKHWWYLG